mmetsp:Transcript_88701/g.185426  ORF Transcript_88701/g.185426 Transcript_88701/m.185426 type:complete len:403 (+) Transcript_88701:210-1418(+)
MPAEWEVVGGADKGGILVREGEGLKSPACEDRLSTGATVEELELKGDRLKYKLLIGTGPAVGWVSLKITGKDLLIKKEATGTAPAAAPAAAASDDAGGPGEGSDPVPVDEELKKKIETMAKEKKEKEAFPLYVMKYKILGFPLEAPKLRVFCFHNAGSAESNFTDRNTPFLKWAKESKAVEVVAVSYPGRDKLLKAQKHESTETLAPDLLAVLYDKLADEVPYVIWGHSVGTWVSFEFLMLARKVGLPMPVAAFWMAFPAPHMPESKRRWRKNKALSDSQFADELLNWDKAHFGGAAKMVFDPPAWKDTWMPLMRADFCLFDEYKFKHKGEPKFSFPIHAWHFDAEHYNTKDQIEMWGDWTTSTFDHQVMKNMGHLTCVYKPEMKTEYYGKVTEAIRAHTGL